MKEDQIRQIFTDVDEELKAEDFYETRRKFHFESVNFETSLEALQISVQNKALIAVIRARHDTVNETNIRVLTRLFSR